MSYLTNIPHRSPLGVYCRSPYGVRTKVGPNMIMLFMNKTVYAYQLYKIVYRNNLPFWTTDIDEWDSDHGEYIPSRWVVQLCDVEYDAANGVSVNPYDSQGTPDDITAYVDFPRGTGTLEQFIAAFEQGYADYLPAYPRRVILLMDNAGAAMDSALGEGLTEFEAWLSNEGIEYKLVNIAGGFEYDRKRYLPRIIDAIEDEDVIFGP